MFEELIDENEIKIEQYITDNKTQIDVLDAYTEFCKKQTTIKSVTVKYGMFTDNTFAYFSYGDYNYYFKLESNDESYMLTLLEDLIK